MRHITTTITWLLCLALFPFLVSTFTTTVPTSSRRRRANNTPNTKDTKGVLVASTTVPEISSPLLQQESRSSSSSLRTLYPPLSPYNSGTQLQVDSIHTLVYQEYGNKEGIPALFLHGGPGAGCFPKHAQFFDPEVYRIVLVDQRGCGQSTPLGEVRRNNTLSHLIEDCEVLRTKLSIDKWGVVLGGSWGSTLALAYAQAYPLQIQSLVLRGVCLMRTEEINYLFGAQGDAAQQNPEAWKNFSAAVNISTTTTSSQQQQQREVLHAYYDRLLSSNTTIRLLAARSWMQWEMTVFSSSPKNTKNSSENDDDNPLVLVGRSEDESKKNSWELQDRNGTPLPDSSSSSSIDDIIHNLRRNISQIIEQEQSHTTNNNGVMRPIQTVDTSTSSDLSPAKTIIKNKKKENNKKNKKSKQQQFYENFIPAQAMLTCFYSVNNEYAMNQNKLLERMDRIRHIPCIAVHGGRDNICPVNTALDVLQSYDTMELRIPLHSGHSMYDPAITNELIQATDRLAAIISPP